MSTGAPTYDYQQVPYTSAPRCSLDFRLVTDQGSVINDSQLRLQGFQGQEGLSNLFEFQLELRANDFTSGGPTVNSTQPYGALLDANYQSPVNQSALAPDGTPLPWAKVEEMDFDDMLGSNATIILGLPETRDQEKLTYPEQRPVVYFNGIISNFAMGERGVYHATVKPALFKLSLQNNFRLFSQCTILEVISQVLSENGIAFNKADLEKLPNKIVAGLANYRKQDWLQAGESDLDFIQRLMQKVHLFFYFTHTLDNHCMIITDQPYYQTIYQDPGQEESEDAKVKSLYLSYSQQASLERDDYITQFNYQQNMNTDGLTTVLAQKQATWESQNTAQVSPVFFDRHNQKQKLNMQRMFMVQFGATEDEVTKLTSTAMKQLQASKFSFSGSSTCPELKAGHKFQVQECWQGSGSEETTEVNIKTAAAYSSFLPIRPNLDKQLFVATSVQHTASINGSYQNQFQARSAAGLATPFSPQGSHTGNIMAIVTDNPGQSHSLLDDILSLLSNIIKKTEKNSNKGSAAKYLQKNAFAFDSKDFNYNDNEKYSCRGVYVRFIDQPDSAEPQWVKLAEHMQTVPEIGSYVLIGRSNDENELPEVQQSLQAKGSKVIMPKDYTCHTNVGDNYNTNYGNSTSINMGADVNTKLEKARKIVETQRDSKHYNDVRYGENSSYGYNVTKHSHNISLLGDGSRPEDNPSSMMDYVSYNHSVVQGDTYRKDKHNGDNKSHSEQDGGVNSYSKHIGTAYRESNRKGTETNISNTAIASFSNTSFAGATIGLSEWVGAENNTSTKTGALTSANNINGVQINGSFVLGCSVSSSKTIGNSTSTSTTTGNITDSQTVIGNMTRNTVVTGNQIIDGQVIGNSTNTNNTVGNTSTMNTVTGNVSSENLVTGNSTNGNTVTGNTTNTSTITGNTTSTNTVTGNATNTSTTTGNATSTNTVTGNATDTTTVAGSQTSSETIASLNKVSSIASGTSTVTDNTVTTQTTMQRTEIISSMVTML